MVYYMYHPYKSLLSILIITVLDSLYINFMKKNFYIMIKKIQNTPVKINLYSLITTYILIFLCYNYFVIYKKLNCKEAFLLGFFIYGIFDLTNLTIFTNWSIFISIIDMIWGGILFFLTTILLNKIIYKK